MDEWLEFNGILNTQVAAISCLVAFAGDQITACVVEYLEYF